jgi:hypothetical protein
VATLMNFIRKLKKVLSQMLKVVLGKSGPPKQARRPRDSQESGRQDAKANLLKEEKVEEKVSNDTKY